MINNVVISKLTEADREAAYRVYEIAVSAAFENEGVGDYEEDINYEIMHKKQMIDASLKEDSDIHFMLAKRDNAVIAAISYGPCSKDIKKCTDNKVQSIGELGSLFVLPEFWGQGIGSALISTMMGYLSEKGIEQFCLDSGYKSAQKRWQKKFGQPCKIVKDYWGPGTDNMIWVCNVKDFIKE